MYRKHSLLTVASMAYTKHQLTWFHLSILVNYHLPLFHKSTCIAFAKIATLSVVYDWSKTHKVLRFKQMLHHVFVCDWSKKAALSLLLFLN